MRWALGLAAGLALAAATLPARAARPGGAAIRIAYQRPAQAETRAIYRDLKARRVLEGLRTIVRGVRLPYALTLRLSACGVVSVNEVEIRGGVGAAIGQAA